MAAEPTCRYAAWVAFWRGQGLVPLDAGDCDGEATHLLAGQHAAPELLVRASALVCVWHAEMARNPAVPGLFVFPHTPLVGARP
jgi:hypothetical protein